MVILCIVSLIYIMLIVMKNLVFLFASLALFCMTACQSSKNEIDETSIHIDWDKAYLGDFEIEDVEYIPLETTDKSLLGSISKIVFRNNRFYVLDKMSGGVYVFDRMGKFLSSIIKTGEGPDEYIELMDMDVDKEGHVYIADNAKMVINKYRFPDWTLETTLNVGKHYWEFCCLDDNCFLLKNVFGKGGMDMKLAHFDGKNHEVTPLVEKAFPSINEIDIMKCSKSNLYRSGEQIYYYERFTPNIYSVSDKGELKRTYSIVSSNYISEGDLKGLQREPIKFMMEKNYIKDIISLFEVEEYFVCMPFIAPTGVFLAVSKNDATNAQKIDLSQKPEFLGSSLIEGVVDGRFFTILNIPNETALEKDERLNYIGEDVNPVLMLFSLKVKFEN